MEIVVSPEKLASAVAKVFEDAEKKCVRACINTVNVQAALARKNALVKTNANFTLRNTWTQRNIKFTKCPSSVTDIDQIESIIGATDKAGYLQRQEEGGKRFSEKGARLSIPTTTARGGNNSSTVKKKFNLSTIKVVHGPITNARANLSRKSRYVARAFVAASQKMLLSNKKTFFLVTNFRKSGDHISFTQTPIYTVKFKSTQTPSKPWLMPSVLDPAKDGQKIYNSQLNKVYGGK